MTNPQIIDSVLIYDEKGKKRLAKPGDAVELIPPSQRLELLTQEERENGEAFFIQSSYDFLRGWLGEGPFEISWIGMWPCGREMLYLKKPNGEPGAYASDFRYIS